MFNRKMLLVSATLFSLALGSPAYSDVTLPALISDNMVLQKSPKTPLWGWAEAGETITVKLNGQTATVTAGKSGKWMTYLDLSKSQKGPFELLVSGHNTITVKNVLVGEVWLASGQSNMEFELGGADHSHAEIVDANDPEIRQFHAAYNTAYQPAPDNKGNPPGWVICAPGTAAKFSAVGYFFAREIHQKVQAPVGLIHTSWGGTPAESWTSQEALSQLPDFQESMKYLTQLQEKYTLQDMEKAQQADEQWLKTAWPLDTGNQGFPQGWAKPEFDDSAWKTIHVPGAFELNGLPNFDGCLWFRKEFTLTEAQTKQDLFVAFGTIDDYDTTYLNGEVIGETNTDPDASWRTFRDYKIPAKSVKVGKNVLAIRVFDRAGAGGVGVSTSADSMNIFAGTQPLFSIAGDWKYQIEKQLPTTDLGKVESTRPRMPGGPAMIYNGMIAPFIPYGIAGVIWYQGEANADRAYQYRTLFPTMITDWRTQWKNAGGQENIPFYFVQLANFMPRVSRPRESTWAELREAQQMTLALPQTGTALAIDIGDAQNIHPTNKQDVGHRLALNALAKVYGQNVEYSGPLFKSKKIEGDKIRLTFTHAEGLCTGRSNAAVQPISVKGFAICGEDRKFVWADAMIDGTSVIVSSPEVKNPTEVRYGWANNPEVNLYNRAGLPASPFRTDTFDGITKPKN